MTHRKSLSLLLAAAVLSPGSAPADWRFPYQPQSCPNGACPSPAQRYVIQPTYAVPTPPAPAYASPQALAAPVQAADAAGFLAWLNGTRARYGLRPVAWDANLASWAVANSRAGFGHAVRMGRRQNAGWGPLGAVCSMWLASPAHAAALLDPTITRVGLGAWGSVWTFNGD